MCMLQGLVDSSQRGSMDFYSEERRLADLIHTGCMSVLLKRGCGVQPVIQNGSLLPADRYAPRCEWIHRLSSKQGHLSITHEICHGHWPANIDLAAPVRYG